MTFRRTGTRKSKSNYKESGKPIQRTHSRGFDWLAVFFVFCHHFRVTVFFAVPHTAMKTVFGNQIRSWWGGCPRQKRKTQIKQNFPEMGAGVVSTKRGFPYCEQNRGIFLRFSAFWNCGKSVHETNCFIEHPPAQTPSGLRAGSPAHHTSFPEHPRASV